MKISRLKAMSAVGLIIATVLWGSGFVVMKNILDSIAPIYLIAARFTVAGILGLIVFYKKIRAVKKKDIVAGIGCGFLIAVAYMLQTYGLKYTSASNNAFLTTFYVILTPFIFWIFKRGRVGMRDFAAAAVAIAGMALLSVTEGISGMKLGDGLTLLCSVAFAIHIYFLDRSAEDRDPVLLAVLQMIGAALLCWIVAPILEGAPPRALITDHYAIAGILYLGVFSTMFAYVMQTSAQKYLSSLTVSILISLECVFGAAFSIFFLGDPFTVKIAFGFVLMAAAVAISTLKKPKVQEGG